MLPKMQGTRAPEDESDTRGCTTTRKGPQCKNEFTTGEAVQEIRERLARIETTLQRIDHDLLGNGQPGAIKRHEDRIQSLETSRHRFMGGVTAMSLVAGFVADSVRHMFGGKG